ncbi:hypothetical protein V6N13_147128 [Hibiscus sabdariffa]
MTGCSSSPLRFFQLSKKAVGFFWRPRSRRQSSRKSSSTLPEELSLRQFSLAEIKAATASFDQGLVIGPRSMSKASIRKEARDEGALGYLVPEAEYHDTEYLSEKIDVYSFGVVLLEKLEQQLGIQLPLKNEVFLVISFIPAF